MPSFDDLLVFCTVAASVLSDTAKHVLLDLRGLADGDGDEGADESASEPVYGALGVVARPRSPSDTGKAEALGARQSDGILPFALRDLRISKARGNVREGSTGIAGYQGAFVAIDDVEENVDGSGSVLTLYVPFADGSKASALSFTTKPGEESVMLAHGSGAAVVLTKNGELVLRSNTGKARVILRDDTIVLQAQKVIAQGNVVLGANPVGAVPLAAPGATSPSVFVSAG